MLRLLLIAALWVAPAKAQTVTNTIYQDQFGGPAGPLNGRTPDTVDLSTNVWLASSGWNIDGAEAYQASTVSCAFLPFVPLPTRIYTLSATLDDYSSTSSGAGWLAIGFADSTNVGANFGTEAGAVGWQLVRDDGNPETDQCFIGPNESGAASEGGVLANGPVRCTIIYDTTPPQPANWTFTFMVVGVVVVPAAPVGGSYPPVINSVALGADNDESLAQDFTLTEIDTYTRPYVITPPAGATNYPGETVSLSVFAGGYPNPTYQWQLNSSNLSAGTSNTLIVSNLASSNSGIYAVIISNSVGSVTSAVEVLVAPATYTIYEDNFTGPVGHSMAERPTPSAPINGLPAPIGALTAPAMQLLARATPFQPDPTRSCLSFPCKAGSTRCLSF